ncbi:MAG: hypothetical protein V7629_08325 [Motiliproteus sp.]
MDAFSQLDKVASKRSALEKLIDIAIGIQSQQQAMEDLSLIAKPSQEIPAKTVQHMQLFEVKYADVAPDELRQKLDLIESTIHELLNRVVVFAQLDVTALRDEEIKGLSVDGFKQLIEAFEQRTKKSLILRFLLKKRGVVLAAFKLPFSQESVAERIQSLRQKESECVAQIKAEAQSIIDDTRVLLASASLPDKMNQKLQSVQAAMQDNLLHLDNGGSVATLPNKFEVIVSQSTEPAEEERLVPATTTLSPGVVAEADEGVNNRPNKAPGKSVSPIQRKKLSTLQLLLKWLWTPWGTSWKSLKENNDKAEH